MGRYNNILEVKRIGLPNLATKVIEGKTKLTFPYLGQRKLNGVRNKIQWVDNVEYQNGLFASESEHIVHVSKEGNQYWMPHISEYLYETLYNNPIYRSIELDGEFYIHGKPLNEIKKSVPLMINGKPSIPSNNPKDITFVIFDIIDNSKLSMTTLDRRALLYNIYDTIKHPMIQKLQSVVIHNMTEATKFRDMYIAEGYEGLILRQFESTYQYGKRNTAMYKYKKALFKEFKILDIIDKGFKSGRVNITVVLQNDLNSNTFEATPGNLDDSWTNTMKQELLDNKDKVIGKYGTISYYERTGKNKLPFHANFITVRDYE